MLVPGLYLRNIKAEHTQATSLVSKPAMGDSKPYLKVTECPPPVHTGDKYIFIQT